MDALALFAAFPRFWAKVNFEGSVHPVLGRCWEWTRFIDPTGYGKFRLAGRSVPSHRLAYEIVVGEIPDGLTIDHLCRNRACVNPAHLEAVTRVENIMRGEGAHARNARKTHCKHGHELAGDNLYVFPNGRRSCRACGQRANREYRARIARQREGGIA